MSQAGIINTQSGPPPPSVPTSFVTDINSPAIPIANVLDVFGGTVTTNNTKGVQTDGSSGSNILTVQLTNRANVTGTTSDGGGQTQNVLLLTPTNNTAITFTAIITGFDSANNVAIGGEQIGLARTSAGTVTVVGLNDTFDESDAALNTADWNVVASGGNLNMQFIGVAGRTITWRALFQYIQVP